MLILRPLAMKRVLLIGIVLFCVQLRAQRTAFNNSVTSNKSGKSNIIQINRKGYEKIILKNAHYNPEKKNFPFFLETKSSAQNQRWKAELKILATRPVSVEEREVIQSELGNFLKSNFETTQFYATAGTEEISYCQIYPFRLNGNILEELTNYEINWVPTSYQPTASKVKSSSFKNNSVLASGNWYKIAVPRSGMYRINRSFLISAGINPANINPKNIRIYGNGGKELPHRNSDFRYDDLEENAIFVAGEADNSFDAEDYILFYAQGTVSWQKINSNSGLIFNYSRNTYSDTAYYFLTTDLGPGKRINTVNSLGATPNHITNTYDYYNFHESDQVNFVKSGRNFYGEYFDNTTSYSFPFNDNNFVTGDTIRVECVIAGRSFVNNVYSVTGNGINFNITCTGFDISNYLSDYAHVQKGFSKTLNTNSSNIVISVTKQTANAVAYLDKVAVNARRELVFNNTSFSFRDSRVCAPGNITEYRISASNPSSLMVWNVSDFINPFRQQTNITGNELNYVATADSLQEYVVFNPSFLPPPIAYGKVNNQNLHAIEQADYVIVTHPLFLSQANRLGLLHQQEEGLSYVVVTTQQVYNEFGSGIADAGAIRDFTRMLYWRGKNLTNPRPVKYLLLMGRGSYHNKNGRPGNSNFIPTYQTENSVSYISSVATDDFYGLMDPNEGFVPENFGAMDVGVGRIVVSNPLQADDVVRKIENYYRKGGLPPLTFDNCSPDNNTSIMGDWRNYIMFSADDGDWALHMQQADDLANKVKQIAPSYNIDKVYIDAYKGLSTPGGKRYPDMQAAFNNRVKKGCLVMNYTGHGGEVGLAAERVVDIPTINSWNNINNLPLFITATCEFSRYDDPDRVSAGELCLLNPKGGSVAMLTTCRLAFSNFNKTLNERIFDYLFPTEKGSPYPALGDVIRRTKANLTQFLYYANFHLLGDPALTLAYPRNKVIMSEINGKPISPSSADTIKALSKVTVKGFIADTSGNKLSSFNGLIYPMVFDKKELIVCQLNDPGSSVSTSSQVPFKFYTQQNIIYKGKSEVKNGDFQFTFMVPKDVSFAYGNARFSFYATNGNIDAGGNYDSVKVGGINPNAIPDNVGPQIKMFLNSKSFVNGGTTNQNPILMAEVTDSSGINTVGTGFGHDITAILDENTNRPYVLNDFYEANLNSYQSGTIRYQFKDIPEGPHTMSLKVWDVQNNSSTAYTDFIVARNEELALNMVLNYPNPFTTQTKFFFEHNRNCEDLKVLIQIFTISGKMAKSIIKTVNCEGFRNEGISWDGRDDYGDKLGRGVYLYKVTVSDKDNKKAEKIEKLVILN